MLTDGCVTVHWIHKAAPPTSVWIALSICAPCAILKAIYAVVDKV